MASFSYISQRCRADRWLVRSPALLVLLTLPVVQFAASASAQPPGTLVWHNEVHLDVGRFHPEHTDAAAGRVVAVGHQIGAGGELGVRVQTFRASTGELLWEQQYDLAGRIERPEDVIVTPTNVVVVGWAQSSPGGDHDILVLNYAAVSGNLLWSSYYDRAGFEDVASAVDIQGRRVVVAGHSAFDPDGDVDAIVQRYDLFDGSLLWTDFVDLAGEFDTANDVVIAGSRAVIVGHGSQSDGSEDLLVAGYNLKSGTNLWTNTYDVDFLAHGLAAAGQGNIVYVVGNEFNDPTGLDMLVQAYAADSGMLLWSDSYDSDGGADVAFDVDVAGDVVVATGAGGPAPFLDNMLTRAYDTTTGTLLWSDEHDVAGGSDVAWAVDISGGVAVIAGTSIENNNHDWIVRAHDLTSGVLFWQERLDVSAGLDQAWDVTHFDGMTFVVGDTQEAGTGSAGTHSDGTVRAYIR